MRNPSTPRFATALAAAVLLTLAAGAAAPAPADAANTADATKTTAIDYLHQPITVDGIPFASRAAYFASDYFRASGNRCATPDAQTRALLYGLVQGGSGADCGAGSTNPDPMYDPGATFEIPVVVHIIENGACTQGNLTDQVVQSQIDILNEDFLAIMGTNGENGTNAEIHFALASIDPGGMPTNGITRTCNDLWWNDNGNYWDTLAWDPHRYLNIYTNNIGGGGILGYVPFLPADGGGGNVGQNFDRVVILWSAFGRNSPLPPFDQGRTATHEVGHYMGLEHTFNGGCATGTPPGCYSSGDLICDTNSESGPVFGCPAAPASCGTPDPFHNYMDYSDDLCMMEFTGEQARRIRCTLEFWRPDLNNVAIFTDGFESGDLSAWSAVVP